MKIRLDFITNSSSSCFIINKSDLTPEQIELLLNGAKLFERIQKTYSTPPCKNKYDRYFEDVCLECESYPCEANEWKIHEVNDKIVGYTMMDNFDMIGFLRSIGIPIADYDDSGLGMAGLAYLHEKYGVNPFNFFEEE